MPTRYTLSSSLHSYNQLARIWGDAPAVDRPAITRASNTIDVELSQDADQKGVPLAAALPNLRELQVPPLLVYFEVFSPTSHVRIIDYERIP